MDRRGSSSQQV